MRKALLGSALSLVAATVQAQIVFGQTDTFTSDVQSWGGANPTWISTGGPGGSTDSFMQLHSVGGSGATSNMAGRNTLQWSGNYTSAGVGSISVDFNNLGQTDLAMRLVFFDSSQATQWSSNATAVLVAGTGWQHFTFVIGQAQFTQVEGTTTFADTMSNVSRMMFRHAPTNSASGTPSVATLGVDNVHAGPVPEPATLCMLGLGLVSLARRRRKNGAS